MGAKTFNGGIYPPGFKELTCSKEITPANEPEQVLIPLSQHIGAPCKPIVKRRDTVKIGQKIGESAGFVSSTIHASISGTVKEIKPVSGFGQCIVIENDGKQEMDPSVKPNPNPENLSLDEMRNIILEAGIVGLGGAMFPSHVKFAPPEDKPIDEVILNGGECEPYLTADHRVMLEKPDRIIAGLKYIMKIVKCNRGSIGVEDNKMDAVEALRKAAAGSDNIEVVALKAKYPQGGEKQLIEACTGREVPSGGLPMDVGIVVNNVGTAIAVADAIENGTPLIQRVVTVTGNGIKNPANYLARIGTPIRELIEQSGGYTGRIGKLISGGPLMGAALYSDMVPVTKGTSGILALEHSSLDRAEERECVRCAKCVDVCPIGLEPTTIMTYSKMGEWDLANENHVFDCIECGSCSFMCPSRIPLIQHIAHAKNMISQKEREEKEKAAEA
ncbi:MAG: electron transport complex subunit RsxC [Clostridia bacterium]|nr:electron transport complex subunit RsxC [Clostridia bacterium]